MNSQDPYSSSERERKIRRRLLTFSIKLGRVWCPCTAVVLLIKPTTFIDVLVAVTVDTSQLNYLVVLAVPVVVVEEVVVLLVVLVTVLVPVLALVAVAAQVVVVWR